MRVFLALALYWSVSVFAEPSIGVSGDFFPGKETFFESKSPQSTFAVVFEDDGTTGYFYALDLSKQEMPILDAVHIYNVANVTDKERESALEIYWSEDGGQAALAINDHVHAVFDFIGKRGYCRTGFPPPSRSWSEEGHDWGDKALGFFR